MKTVAATFAVIAGLCAPAFAQTEAAAPEVQAAPDAAMVQKAEQLLKDSAKAYAQAKALTDVITFEAKAPTGDQTETIKVWLQGDDTARISMTGMTVTAVGQSLFVERESVTDLFAELPLSDSIADSMQQQVGFVPPQLIARGSSDVSAIIDAFLFRMLPDAKITGYALKSEGGKDVHEIALSGVGGDGAIMINTKSMLVQGARVRIVPPGAPEGFEVVATQTYQPTVSDTLATAIAFEPGTRRKVSSLGDLKVDLTGKTAPDFTLPTLDGKQVTLSDLKGSMVVLDFWATWCGPCKMALPKLQEFATWAKDNNKPVKVFAVNVWERTKGDATLAAVSKFWSEKGYTMPTLLDADNKSAEKYAFESIPTTIIVDPEGKVFRIHSGYNPDMVAELQRDLEEILARADK